MSKPSAPAATAARAIGATRYHFPVPWDGSASTGSRVLVSKGGGTAPRWRRDGKELFYLAADERMMAVEMSTGIEFRATTPIPLFQAPPGAIVGDVSADGKRFLLIQSAAAPFTVVLNWLQN